jgi:5-methylcytosine-specific restriction endonuclease McrA
MSCAGQYNNLGRNKKTIKCKNCDTLIISGRTYCPNCIKQYKHITNRIDSDRTLAEMCSYKKMDANRFNSIREHASRILKSKGKPCERCGYSIHVQVCHIKPISQFPKTALLSEINALSNLILLCPNCHWEFDHGIITLEQIRKSLTDDLL